MTSPGHATHCAHDCATALDRGGQGGNRRRGRSALRPARSRGQSARRSSLNPLPPWAPICAVPFPGGELISPLILLASQTLGVDEWVRTTGNTRGDFVPNPGDMQLPAALRLGYQVTKSPVKQLHACGQPRASLARSTTVVTEGSLDKFKELWAKIDELPIGRATRSVVEYLFEDEIGARAPILDGDLVGRLLALIDSRGLFCDPGAFQLFDMLILHCGCAIATDLPSLACLSPPQSLWGRAL